MARRLFIYACLAAIAAVLGGASCGEDEHPCVDDIDLECNELYTPEFSQVFARTLQPTCGVDGPCHSPEAAKGGMVFRDEQTSYDLLLGNSDGRARVIPGDPSCSELSKRLHSDSVSYQMPPGKPLSEAETCSIMKWIANGAQR